ncbi:MAG: carbonic anhydrase family protein [Nitrospirota bacterium]|mgnify:CR=1 FL=1
MPIKNLFFWVGLFFFISLSSCAYAKSEHKKSDNHGKSEKQMSSHEELSHEEEESEHEENNHKKSKHSDSKKGHGASKGHAAHWAYKGEGGPKHWGDLKSEFKTCKTGKKQSPIDLSKTKGEKLNNIRFHYNPSMLNIVNNGHTIQVDYDKGSFIRIDGVKYDLLQFHFHTPSEHTIEEGRYPMELHLVHKDKKGNLAVVGIMMVVGKHNDVLDTLWDNLPPKEGKEHLNKKINMANILPPGERTFRYSGSLTTPPCSEDVRWNVFLAPIAISNEQFLAFHDIFDNNSRPIQSIGKRVLWEDSTP